MVLSLRILDLAAFFFMLILMFYTFFLVASLGMHLILQGIMSLQEIQGYGVSQESPYWSGYTHFFPAIYPTVFAVSLILKEHYELDSLSFLGLVNLSFLVNIALLTAMIYLLTIARNFIQNLAHFLVA